MSLTEPAQQHERERHPSVFEPTVLAAVLFTSIAGALIGLQIITSLGVTPNTSIMGVLASIVVSRIPLSVFRRFRSTHRQNLVQTSISSATFAAANSLLLPIGIPVVIGEPGLMWPMLIGASLAMVIDLLMLYWMFDTRVFPAENAWPSGVAAAETIIAGDRGGKRAKNFGYGIALGVAGSWFGLPMAPMGVAFIAKSLTMLAFAVGLLAAGYSQSLFGFALGGSNIPNGMMIGAGLVALAQAIMIVFRHRKAPQPVTDRPGDEASAPPTDAPPTTLMTRTDKDALRGLRRGTVLYISAGLTLAVLGGLYSSMAPLQLVLWVLFAAVACICAELIVGLSAMHAGWFPAFATALIFLILGMLMHFPVVALVLLVGFVAAGSPAFADGGYDFKTGWLLRGQGTDRSFELEGRRQQLYAGLVGLAVAVVVVALTHSLYFDAGLFPPVDKAYSAAIRAGLDTSSVAQLALWALPGALIQLAGGPSRQLGVLLATGLLVANPQVGWIVAAGMVIRWLVLRVKGPEASTPMTIFAAGIIAGSAMYSFSNAAVKTWSR
ncbi:hypothetical protein LK07_10090 [Streptomyces pluripotens]|uniref:OPT family oligopeptide transporter n=1 Tax=Streptomyces pluripotens TaxID=1355015 RepID=A0A221P8K9_9ACTN|nr:MULTISPECIES: OPT/YSL family transporter [Streptomyces]ARP74049.1 hypothetical protein LK06_008980 [Streptomyces pluripotens]ASN28308.1 hypothetical protein LK07_10090 [Streptomyces pluripotens]KIE25380.1 membrane protein [Streptomyces sp. MUSC 125]MCH0561296.1 OPT/YSL family transporter [Streptomyces sp. MUM 16J]